MRRPALTALPMLAVPLPAASPLLGITFGTPDERVLPEGAGSRQVAAALRDNFNGDDAALHVVIDQPLTKATLAVCAAELSRLEGVVRVETSAGTYAEGGSTAAGPGNAAFGRPDAQRISVVSSSPPRSDEPRPACPPHPREAGTGVHGQRGSAH